LPRHFYVSFLAALEIDRNAERYFGHFEAYRDRAARHAAAFRSAAALERASAPIATPCAA